MKKIYLLLLLGIVFSNLNSQTYSWAKREGLYAYDYGMGITTDPAGNIYVGGKYEMNAVFSGNTLTCAGNHDGYLVKYDPSGNLTWIRTYGGALGDYLDAVTSDANYIYVAGEIEGYGTITFPGSTVTLQGQGDNDILVAKYDLNGNLMWARSSGMKYNESAIAVACDPSGNVYISGHFSDTTKIGTTTLYGNTLKDFFVAKYDANGNFLWVRQGGGPGKDDAKSIVCDAAGNVYIAGFYSSGAMIGSTTYSTTSGMYDDTFVAKYDTNGNLMWVQTAGGDYDDVIWGMTIDAAGMLYVTGEFNAAAYFGSTQLITAGNADIFVACYDGNGAIQWAKRGGGPLVDRARGIGTDGTNLYVTGQFGGTALFGTSAVTAGDSSDVFFASMTNTGNFTAAGSITGPADGPESLGYEAGNAITCKDGSNIYATGAILDGGVCGSYSLSPYSRTDAFVVKMTSLLASTHEAKADPKDFYVYPNPGNGNIMIFSDKVYPDADVTVYNALGQVITKRSSKTLSKLNIDLSNEQNGIYFVEIKSENKTVATKKLVVNN
jgi:hypothetical protein